MKIKRERQVRLDELLRYVWDNGIKDEQFFIKSSEGRISIDTDGDFNLGTCDFVNKHNLFTITEEVEIDEYTELRKVVHIDKFGETYDHRNVTIKWLIQYHEDSALGLSDLRYIYLQNEDGSIGELIWKDGGLV